MGCPMGFGELNIPSSRAFWDDCEEDELIADSAEKLKLNFEADQDQKPIVSELFVLIEGLNISEFAAKSLLQNTKLICKIPAKHSSLHLNVSKKQLICILEDDLNNSGEVAQLLLPYAEKALQLVTITLKPKVDYKSEEINKYQDVISIVRGINGQLKNVPELEAPNFIAGAAAGIASWRDCAELPVSSYVVYTDKLPLDAVAAQPVLKLLQEVGLDCANNYAPPRRDDSHLYL